MQPNETRIVHSGVLETAWKSKLFDHPNFNMSLTLGTLRIGLVWRLPYSYGAQ